MENKKYELLDNDTVTTWDGHALKRIRALVAIGSLVAAGELGGYIESEDNLSQVSGNAWVSGDARVEQRRDIFWLSIIGSENGTYTAFKNKDGGVSVNRGCFNGTLEQFSDAVNERHAGQYHQEYQLVIELTKIRLGVIEEAV